MRTSLLLVAAGLAAVSVGGAAASSPPSTERVSLGDGGTQPDAEVWPQASITPDGRFVVFATASSTLAPGAAGGTGPFVYVRDRATGTTELASRGLDGAAPNGPSVENLGAPVVSADGRYVAFASRASNLVADDDNAAADVFVLDRESGATRRVSVATDGRQANGQSLYPSISADGRVVVFASQASNLVGGDGNGTVDVFAHNVFSGETVRVSVGAGGAEATGPSSVTSGAVSGDGRYVAFTSTAPSLVPDDGNGATSDVFVRDLATQVTELAARSNDGLQLTTATGNAFISEDGRRVAFQCLGVCAALPGSHGSMPIFVRDRSAGTVEEATVSSTGEEASSATFVGGLSPDGRHVAFSTNAPNLDGPSPYGVYELYVRDVDTGTTERVSVSSTGDRANDSSITSGQILGLDGRVVLFSSTATNLVPDDTNGHRDLFVRDRGGADTPPDPDPGPGPVLADLEPPTISCTAPAAGWHRDNVTLACTATDAGSGLAAAADADFALSTFVPDGSFDASASTNARLVCDLAGNCAGAGPIVGIAVDRTLPTWHCAGPDGAWHGENVSVQCGALDTGSGLAPGTPAVFFLHTDVSFGKAEASTTTGTAEVCDAAGNCVYPRVGGFAVDLAAPHVSCQKPDSLWHGDNVSFACTSSDEGAGLLHPEDASFSLVTTVPDGTEVSNAETGDRIVCDAVGNCTDVQRIAPVRVDRRSPSGGEKSIDPLPNADGWNHTDVDVYFDCHDGGSGVVDSHVSAHLTQEGAHQEVHATCTDRVGHTTTLGWSHTVSIDRTPPSVALPEFSRDPVRVGEHVSVQAGVLDALSGVKSAEVSGYGGSDVALVSGTMIGVLLPIIDQAGVWEECLRATDRAGNVSAWSCSQLVVYDPDAGWVTGSGRLAGADGARFELHSRYGPGANVPTGNLHFRIPSAQIDLRSTAWQWLVVNGPRARLRGRGTIDGGGSYAFLVTVVDGDAPGGDGIDRFRIRIWDVSHAHGAVVYDSQPGAPDDAAPTTAVAAGQLSVHH